MSLNHLTNLFLCIGEREIVALAKYIDERITEQMRADLQPIVDKLNELQTTYTTESQAIATALTDIKAGIVKLQGEVAAGNPVTQADLQPLIDQVTAIEGTMATDQAAVTAEDAAAKQL